MKKLLLILVLIVSCSSLAMAAEVIDESQVIDPFDLDGSLDGKVLIDIRVESDFWDYGKIEGSIAIPLHQLLISDQLPAKDAEIIVISQEGPAGELAILGLNALGYQNVKLLDGGVSLWKMMGLPVVEVPRPASAAPVAGGC